MTPTKKSIDYPDIRGSTKEYRAPQTKQTPTYKEYNKIS